MKRMIYLIKKIILMGRRLKGGKYAGDECVYDDDDDDAEDADDHDDAADADGDADFNFYPVRA